MKKPKGEQPESMRLLRAARGNAELCTACGNPVAVSTKTGRPATLCQIHLEVDAARKAARRLATAAERLVPLRWTEDAPVMQMSAEEFLRSGRPVMLPWESELE